MFSSFSPIEATWTGLFLGVGDKYSVFVQVYNDNTTKKSHTMSVLVNKNTRLIVQGITGGERY